MENGMDRTENLPLGVTAVMLPELGFDEQVELCRTLGVTHYVYRPRVIGEEARGQAYANWGNHKFDLTPMRLLSEGSRLRKRLADAGLVPYGTVPTLLADAPKEELELHFDGAAEAGAPRVRLNPPNYPREVLFDYAAYLDRTIELYRSAAEIARPRGVKMVIEMHAGNAAVAPGLARSIVQHFDPADLGVIVDLPNHAREGGVTPNLAISALRDWIDHCHFGGSRRVYGTNDELGFRRSETHFCSITDSDLHVPTWVRLLGDLGRVVPLVIEDYTPNMPGATRLAREVAAARRMLDAMAPAPA